MLSGCHGVLDRLLKTVALVILFLLVSPSTVLAAPLDCPATEVVELDWSARDWPAPSNPAGNNNYIATLSHTEANVSGVDFTFTFSSDVGNANFLRSLEAVNNAAYYSPDDFASVVGPGGGEEGLVMIVLPTDSVTGAAIDMDVIMDMTLSTPIDELEFSMSDIDGSGNRLDRMTVTASLGGVNVPVTLSYKSAPPPVSVYTITGNVAEASGATNVSPTSNPDNGTVIVNVNSPIDALRVVYADASEAGANIGGLRGTTMGNTFKICKNADLSITKTDNVANSEVGDTLTYAIEVSNDGPHPSGTGVTISDTLPGDITVNGGGLGAVALSGANSASWSCASNAASPQVISCTYTGAAPGLAVNGSSAFNFVTDAIPASVFQTTITNTIEVIRDPDVPDPDPDNNDDIHDTPIVGVLLTLVKIVDNTGGGTATVTNFPLTANGGAVPITGVSGTPAVTDVPIQPGTLTLSEATVPDYTAGSWVCTGANAASGAKIRIIEGNDVTCTITNTYDPPPEVDLKITKGVSDNEPQVGSTVTFTLTIENIGSDDATMVDITDIVPAGYTYVAGSIAGGDTQDDSSPTGTGLEWIINSFLAGDPAINLTFIALVNNP